MSPVLRHGLAAVIVLALLAPLFPERNTAMPCCLGTGEACACPIGPGFSRCEPAPPVAPFERPPALMPSPPNSAAYLEAGWVALPRAEDVAAFPLDLPDPVPRA